MIEPDTNQLFFILYAGLFRLAMIGAGTFSLYLGYKLFVKGVFDRGGSGTGIDASVGDVNFSVKNAAPGSFFAICGVLIIISMFITGGPEWSQSSSSGLQRASAAEGGILIRSDDTDPAKMNALIQAQTEIGKELAKADKIGEAVGVYHNIFRNTGEAANNLAWHLLKEGEPLPARALSQLAVYYHPDEPEYLDTLAEVYFHFEQYSQAVDALEAAIATYASNPDPRFTQKLERFLEVMRNAQ